MERAQSRWKKKRNNLNQLSIYLCFHGIEHEEWGKQLNDGFNLAILPGCLCKYSESFKGTCHA